MEKYTHWPSFLDSGNGPGQKIHHADVYNWLVQVFAVPQKQIEEIKLPNVNKQIWHQWIAEAKRLGRDAVKAGIKGWGDMKSWDELQQNRDLPAVRPFRYLL
jgi:hypothetical protein